MRLLTLDEQFFLITTLETRIADLEAQLSDEKQWGGPNEGVLTLIAKELDGSGPPRSHRCGRGRQRV